MTSTALAGGAVAAAALVLSTVAGLWHRRRSGAFRPAPAAPVPRQRAAADHGPLLRELGVEPGAAATILQFSSAFCAPCRATRRLAAEVGALLPGVRHVEVDAESHLDAVRALAVWRTPTVLIVDAGGRIASRAAGQPTKAQLIAAVAPLVDSAAVAP